MTEFKNPFVDMDLTKMMGEFKLPGVDPEALAATQKKNIEALTNANQLAVEGLQAVARRQMEIFQQTMTEATKQAQEMMSAEEPQAKAAKQAEIVKVAYEKALSNMRELADMVRHSNTEAISVVNNRVTESLEELREALDKSGK